MDYNGEINIMNEETNNGMNILEIKLIISTLNTTIEKLEKTVSELNKTVQKVEINNKENSLLIETLSSSVDNLNTRMERHSDRIINLENKADKSKANLVDKISWIVIAAATSGIISMVVKHLNIGVSV